ncbi:MAG: YggS family pyridoxal phosphate-dependent enzyme [bacterium]|nr:YggS family pyridoxal phosphate-dependent enzyme [bacterium]
MIRDNVQKIINELPQRVELVAVIKGRSPEDILTAVEAGVKILGVNYIKDVRNLFPLLDKKVSWHYIGIASLEKHDLLRRKYLEIFDMIETVDSVKLAEELDKRCANIGKVMPILIEVNIAKEPQKSGVIPEELENIIREILSFKYVRIMGLMTMGPLADNPEKLRPYFKEMKRLFNYIDSLKLPNVEMKYLSMGMSDSYKVAIEEGANIVRIGTKLFE